jgi:hypothetical protein
MNMEEAEIRIKKMRELRKKLLMKAMPFVSVLIFGAISSYALNWVFNKYGIERLIISCTILLAIVIMNSRGNK